MNFKKPLICAALLAAGFASAQANAGVAIGGSAGASRVDGSNFDSDDLGWKAFVGGYGKIVGLEGQYVDFGALGGPANPQAHAWVPALVVGVPVGVVNIYGKVGEAFYTIEETALTQEHSDNKIMWGVGVRAGQETGLGVRLEYERYKLQDVVGNDADVDLISAGVEFRF